MKLIQGIVKLLNVHGLASIEYEQDGKSIRMVSGCPQDALTSETAKPGSPSSDRFILAPGMGTVQLALQDEMSNPKQHIQAGDTVGYLEIGPLRTEIKSTTEGCIKRILVNNNELIGFGQPLISLSACDEQD